MADDYVKECATINTGTGIVHLAPLFGEDDYRVCKEQCLITDNILQKLEIINKNCIILELPFLDAKYHKKLILDTEIDIIKDLKIASALVKIQQIRREYPFCYRTDTPLIYRACESFYVDIQTIKPQLIEINSKINWYPSHIGKLRFHNLGTNNAKMKNYVAINAGNANNKTYRTCKCQI